MRDLRLKRKNIERGFLDRFYEAFVRIGHAEPMLLPTSCLGSVRVVPKKAVRLRSWRVSGCSRSSTVAY